MLIDWFTVGAQMLNFIVLAWLLKRYLYKPILDAIDVREKRIAAQAAAADTKTAAAQKALAEFEDKKRTFDAERGALLAEAAAGARADRAHLLESADKETRDLRAQRLMAMESERISVQNDIERLAVVEVYEVARKALRDLASVSLEERMVATLSDRLSSMDLESKEIFRTAIVDSPAGGTIRSRFELADREKASLQDAFNRVFSAPVKLGFVTDPGAICGIEANANGQRLAWNIADYLASLEARVTAILKVAPAPAVAAVPAPNDRTPVAAKGSTAPSEAPAPAAVS